MTPHPRKLTRVRELDALPVDTLVMVSGTVEPRYFRRAGSGWHAADAHGDTALHDELVRDLSGWPEAVPSRDLLRPVYVVAEPHELPARDELDPGIRARLDAHALVTRWAVA